MHLPTYNKDILKYSTYIKIILHKMITLLRKTLKNSIKLPSTTNLILQLQKSSLLSFRYVGKCMLNS